MSAPDTYTIDDLTERSPPADPHYRLVLLDAPESPDELEARREAALYAAADGAGPLP